MNCCVYFTYMHNTAYYQSKYGMPDCLNYESTHPTLKGQCGLEGIVIKCLLGINQFKDKLTSNSQYPSMLLSQKEWEPIDTTLKKNWL